MQSGRKLILEVIGKPAFHKGRTARGWGVWFALLQATTTPDVFWWRILTLHCGWPPIKYISAFSSS